MSDEKTGILLTNLGSPDAPTTGALRRYLREFLGDPRVVELPRVLWWFLLNAIILNLRPRRSARLYRRVWSQEGAPLLAISKRQTAAIAGALATRLDPAPAVALGMRYGNPSIGGALESLRNAGCTRILVLPLYPQYFAGTSGSSFDAVARAMMGWRRVPALRFVDNYHADEGYIRALAASIRELWERDGEPDRLLLSFHGIPVRYAEAGDPYAEQCQRTANLLAAALGLPYERWLLSYQSRFGREAWLEPFTDATLRSWGAAGVRRVDVVCPGFAADCLETLEEIDMLNRRFFLDAGGERFRYIPALNDRAPHIEALAALVTRNLQGW
jgi:protoporphyrin/coproporphyrin ferrochelatase